MRKYNKKHILTATIPIVLSFHAVILFLAARVHSPVIDEVGHLAAGIDHWDTGRFDLYRVNPPLVRMVATFPAFLSGASLDSRRCNRRPWARPEFELGRRFIHRHGAGSLRYFMIARIACIPFATIGGLVCFSWSRDLYGDLAGLVALVLWCFSPTILAHSMLITPDAGAASVAISASYLHWRWLRRPSWGRATLAGVVLGIALLSKFTNLIFLLLWPVSWAIFLASRSPRGIGAGPADPDSRAAGVRAQVAHLLLMLVLSFDIVNLGYVFEGSFRPLQDFEFTSTRIGRFGDDPYDTRHCGNPFARTPFGRIPVPFPYNFVQGVDVQCSDFEKETYSYLRGTWRAKGWYYYYVYCYIVKEPAGTLCLACLAVASTCRHPHKRIKVRDELCLALPIVSVFLLVSSQTGLNHHIRYVLPAFPFLCIGVSRVFSPAVWRAPAAKSLGGCFLLWSVGSSLLAYPHNLSYFNELAGGPLVGHRHLHGSNLDWGQDLLLLKEWCDKNPSSRPLNVVYYGGFDPADMGPWGPRISFSYTPIPAECQPGAPGSTGWYAISVGRLHGPPEQFDEFARFRERTPNVVIGYTLYIFKN